PNTGKPPSVVGIEHEAFAGSIMPRLFYSSSGVNLDRVDLMGPGSAFHWGWSRRVPGTCCVFDDKRIFCHNGQPKPELYFRRLATVPVNMVCMDWAMGLLVITSMQEEPFHSDILETMQFLASVISQYDASHTRCV